MDKLILHSLAIVAFAMAASASAQKPSAYPAKGQSAGQQGVDDAECLAWAKQDTGIDPAAVAATPPPPAGPQGERVRGAVRGAAAGAVIGEVAHGDSRQGAGVGATAGVVAGGARARRNRAAQTQQAQASRARRSTPTTVRMAHACRVADTA